MISLPADVKKKESWNGSSLDIPTQTLVANLESLMNFAEHQRIVCEARGLIATMNYTAEQLQENAARRALVLLKDAAFAAQAEHDHAAWPERAKPTCRRDPRRRDGISPEAQRRRWAGETAVLSTKKGATMDCNDDGTRLTHLGGKRAV